MRGWLAVAAVATVMTGACRADAGPAAPARTLGAAPTASATAAHGTGTPVAADVERIPPPDAIDLAYVQRVVDAIDARLGELGQHVASVGGVDEEALLTLSTLYGGGGRAVAVSMWQEFFPPLLGDEPRAPRTEVVELRTVSRDCVSFAATRDYLPLGSRIGTFPQPFSMALRPAGRDYPHNPTAWVLVQEQTDAEGQGRLLPDPCAEGRS